MLTQFSALSLPASPVAPWGQEKPALCSQGLKEHHISHALPCRAQAAGPHPSYFLLSWRGETPIFRGCIRPWGTGLLPLPLSSGGGCHSPFCSCERTPGPSLRSSHLEKLVSGQQPPPRSASMLGPGSGHTAMNQFVCLRRHQDSGNSCDSGNVDGEERKRRLCPQEVGAGWAGGGGI